MNKDMAQFELDDDVLDNVSGGVQANQVCNCKYCMRISTNKPVSCSNCYNYDDGDCEHISELG